MLSTVSLDSGCVGIFSFLWRQAIRFVTYDLVISPLFSVTLPEFVSQLAVLLCQNSVSVDHLCLPSCNLDIFIYTNIPIPYET